jgi:hypothetical protein
MFEPKLLFKYRRKAGTVLSALPVLNGIEDGNLVAKTQEAACLSIGHCRVPGLVEVRWQTIVQRHIAWRMVSVWRIG